MDRRTFLSRRGERNTFCTLVGCTEISATRLQGIAGTTRLELAISAATEVIETVT